MDEFDVLINDQIRVDLEYIGEGMCGDYREDDPQDERLCRFTVSEWNRSRQEWEDIDDASYCTCIPDSATPTQKKKAIEIIMNRVKPLYDGGRSIKKTCEELSHLNIEDIERVLNGNSA